MIAEVVKRCFFGLSFSAVFTFIALTVLTFQQMEVEVSLIWLHMLGSMLMGIYFGAASLLYDIEAWSPLKQTTIHFILSVLVFFSIALFVGWIPLQIAPIIIGFSIFVVTYIIFWLATSSYLNKMTAEMNNSLKRK